MSKSNILLEVRVGRKKLTITCDEDEASAVSRASKRFQKEINKIGETLPNESPHNRILLAGINIADNLNKIEMQPRIREGLIDQVKDLVEKAEETASRFKN
ncbi:MAG: cell division protein ZapA [Rhodobacteraceae bacterium]|nr:cell division protein ZapA [Paracoccaceae bacterium]MCY4249299.1 cell division protein ZapA [Paracoccaceae bacterium]MCY4308228.1 cell division protein ZapA [Paracoccaceae bacterium]